MHYMELGGAEISLIGLLGALDYERVDVDLFIYAHRGELMSLIPPQVTLLPEVPSYAHIEAPLAQAVKRGHWGVALGRLLGKAHRWLNQYTKRLPVNASVSLYAYEHTTPFLPNIGRGEYDLAISFLDPFQVVLKRVKARKKMGWIHIDFSTFVIDTPAELRDWARLDYIGSISPAITRNFLTVFPTVRDKIVEIENILPEAYIKRRLGEFSHTFPKASAQSINLLSVGRFSTQKNFDNVPAICALVRQHGLDVNWYLIGYGPEEADVRRKIREAGMQEHVFVLGKKSNPYPYIKACDVYVQPSRFEGKSIVVREAQYLGKPVIITNYSSSASQLTDGYDGLIVPLDNEGCAAGIAAALKNPQLLEQITANVRRGDYVLGGEVEKIYQLL